MKPLKLLFLVSHGPGGGAQEAWANLAEGLQAHGATTRLFALYHLDRGNNPIARIAPWTYISPARPQTLLQRARLVVALIRLLRSERPDILLTALPAANVIGPVAALIADRSIRCVISHHSLAHIYSRTIDQIDSITGQLPNVPAVVCVSRAVADTLKHKPSGYRSKLVTIGNALPRWVMETISELRMMRQERKPGRCVVATGRLSPEKNYPLILRAARHLPDVTFAIVGAGPLESGLRQMASDFGLDDRIRFHGHLSRGETLAVLATGDVFVQPSRVEGHSLALLEAASLGLPLIVSDVPAQVDAITRHDGVICGQLVGPEDDRRFAEIIHKTLGDAEIRTMWSERALSLVDENAFEIMLGRYETIIRGQTHE